MAGRGGGRLKASTVPQEDEVKSFQPVKKKKKINSQVVLLILSWLLYVCFFIAARDMLPVIYLPNHRVDLHPCCSRPVYLPCEQGGSSLPML